MCRGIVFVGPTRRRREVAVAEEGRGRADEDAARVTVAEAGRATEADDGRGRAAETEAGRAADADDGRTAEAEAGRVPNRDRFFCEVAAAAARARLILRLSGRGGLPALKASLWRRPRVGGRCRFCLMNVGFPRCASASSNPRMRRSWGSKCVSWMLYSSSPCSSEAGFPTVADCGRRFNGVTSSRFAVVRFAGAEPGRFRVSTIESSMDRGPESTEVTSSLWNNKRTASASLFPVSVGPL